MKRVAFVLIVMLVLGLLAGCGSTSYIVFAGSPEGSSFYSMAVGIGDLINEHTTMTVKVESIGSSPAWLPLFGSGEADLGLMSSDDAYQAFFGLGEYEDVTEGEGYDFSTLQVGSPLLTCIIVKNDSDIWRITDLEGKTVPSEFGGMPAAQRLYNAFLASGGLTYDDVIPFPVATTFGPDIKDAFVQGKIDCMAASLGSAIVTELDNAVGGVRFVTLESTPEAVARMQEQHHSYLYLVESGSFPGVKDDIYVSAHDVALVARTTLGDDAVYEIMNATWDNYEELAPVHPMLKQWLPDGFATTGATVPYHPAAIDFYKEKGVWTAELEEHQNELLTLE